jgi:hypothetical protein
VFQQPWPVQAERPLFASKGCKRDFRSQNSRVTAERPFPFVLAARGALIPNSATFPLPSLEKIAQGAANAVKGFALLHFVPLLRMTAPLSVQS